MKNKKMVGIIIAIIAAITVIAGGIGLSDSLVLRDEPNGTTSIYNGENGETLYVDAETSGYENVLNENNKTGKTTVPAESIAGSMNGGFGNYKADLDAIPAFSGKAYYAINNNIPGFNASYRDKKYFESYEALDGLGRCGVAYACLGRETMPTEERGEIGQIKPSGWQSVKYDSVDGKYLYNRCHLIGFQLSGENANDRNLITGTRYMNVEGMLPFENMVADYIKETGNHVLYRVTPIFKGSELVARGVQIEAFSVEDDGEGICFNVYCYNNQPGITIDYETGKSELSKGNVGTTAGKAEEKTADYVLNTSSKKIHLPSCSSVKSMSSKNKEEYSGSKNELLKQGYTECGYCKP